MPLNLPNTFFKTPTIFQNFDHLVAAQSTRLGGVSPSPYASLNLGLFTQDKVANVQENRRRFFTALGISESQTAGSYQVHKDKVKVIEAPTMLEGYDALVTNKPDVYLTITIADCVPVLIYDPVQQVVAAAHAGWKGTVAQIAQKTIQTMTRQFGSLPINCKAFIGICIEGAHYEVGTEVANHFPASQKNWHEERQKYYVDLKKANQDQLRAAGVLAEHIEVSSYSTVANNDTFFSHRYEKGTTGRMLAVIGMKG